MSKRKHYSPEYKRELVRRSQSSCRQIVLEVGVNTPVLNDYEKSG